MKTRLPTVSALLFAAACGGGEGGPASVRGAFREGQLPDGPDTVYVREQGASARVPVLDGVFALERVSPGEVTLRFVQGEDDAARMELRGVPEGGAVELAGIRIDAESGLAFPASVSLEGAETVVVNGIRYAARPLPPRVEADGVVLAAARDGDAFLVRPADASLPDLRVVVGPLTETVTPDGDPVPAGELERGDSVRVEGATEGGYLLASRIVGPRALALRQASAREIAPERDDGAREAAALPAAQPRTEDAVREEATGRDESRGRDEAKGRDDGRGKGKGRGEEKGRGKGRG